VTLGDRLRRWREDAGLDQEAVASIVLVSQQTVSEWERDKSRPVARRAVRLAEALGIEEAVVLDAINEATTGRVLRRSAPHGASALSGVSIPEDFTDEERAMVQGYVDALSERRRGRVGDEPGSS